ncbi:hypothetical protein PIB30_067684 [Stylosanthes scabra]|uniref:Uncharacterized protein n=1 Tax=Stylosanthes scabra TaxID=79078 RepID=A0ABU6TN91_9FABA|nr:hypothetical protein [Stylosanthes scabra]
MGEKPDIQAMWQITHQKTNGEWVIEKAKEIDEVQMNPMNLEILSLQMKHLQLR